MPVLVGARLRQRREAAHQVLQETTGGGNDRGSVRVPANPAEEQQSREGGRPAVTARSFAQAAILLRKRRGVPIADRGDVSARVLSYPLIVILFVSLSYYTVVENAPS